MKQLSAKCCYILPPIGEHLLFNPIFTLNFPKFPNHTNIVLPPSSITPSCSTLPLPIPLSKLWSFTTKIHFTSHGIPWKKLHTAVSYITSLLNISLNTKTAGQSLNLPKHYIGLYQSKHLMFCICIMYILPTTIHNHLIYLPLFIPQFNYNSWKSPAQPLHIHVSSQPSTYNFTST